MSCETPTGRPPKPPGRIMRGFSSAVVDLNTGGGNSTLAQMQLPTTGGPELSEAQPVPSQMLNVTALFAPINAAAAAYIVDVVWWLLLYGLGDAAAGAGPGAAQTSPAWVQLDSATGSRFGGVGYNARLPVPMCTGATLMGILTGPGIGALSPATYAFTGAWSFVADTVRMEL